MEEFVGCYHAENRHDRQPTWTAENPDGRWRAYDYDVLIQRDKVSLDLVWLRDESLEGSANLPDPDVIAEDLRRLLTSLAQRQALMLHFVMSGRETLVG